MTGRVKKDRSFEDAMARLEAIVSELEGEDEGLERQFALFQEGMELARLCDKKLGEVEKSVEIVLKDASGEWKTAPFDPGRAAEDDDDRG